MNTPQQSWTQLLCKIGIGVLAFVAVGIIVWLQIRGVIDAHQVETASLLGMAVVLFLAVGALSAPHRPFQMSLRELLLITFAVAAYFAGRAGYRDEAQRERGRADSLAAQVLFMQYEKDSSSVDACLRSLPRLRNVSGMHRPLSFDGQDDELITVWEVEFAKHEAIATIEKEIADCIKPLEQFGRKENWRVWHVVEVIPEEDESDPPASYRRAEVIVTAHKQ